MTTYPQIARAFYMEPLALEEKTMLSIHMWLWPRVSGQVSDPEALTPKVVAETDHNDVKREGAGAHMRKRLPTPAMQSQGPFAAPIIIDPNYYWTIGGRSDVAVIPICGMLSKGAGPFEEMCMGVVNPDRVSHALRQAIANPQVKTIVLDVDSPGGRSVGIHEVAALVAQARQTKLVYAFSDGSIASAATWIASQATECYLSPSAAIGSIGTYLAFLNPKVAMQMQGYTMEFFARGTHKGIGLPGRDLTQQDREYLSATVEELNQKFVADVKSGRSQVSEEAVRDAKMYFAGNAVTQGLADGIVEGWDEFVGML